MYLTRVDGHAALANNARARCRGHHGGDADPAGGRLIRDADGKPTGVLVDRAMGLVARQISAAVAAAAR